MASPPATWCAKRSWLPSGVAKYAAAWKGAASTMTMAPMMPHQAAARSGGQRMAAAMGKKRLTTCIRCGVDGPGAEGRPEALLRRRPPSDGRHVRHLRDLLELPRAQ